MPDGQLEYKQALAAGATEAQASKVRFEAVIAEERQRHDTRAEIEQQANQHSRQRAAAMAGESRRLRDAGDAVAMPGAFEHNGIRLREAGVLDRAQRERRNAWSLRACAGLYDIGRRLSHRPDAMRDAVRALCSDKLLAAGPTAIDVIADLDRLEETMARVQEDTPSRPALDALAFVKAFAAEHQEHLQAERRLASMAAADELTLAPKGAPLRTSVAAPAPRPAVSPRPDDAIADAPEARTPSSGAIGWILCAAGLVILYFLAR